MRAFHCSRMTIGPRIPAMPARSTLDSHRPGRHCLHLARSTVRCWARRIKGETGGGGVIQGVCKQTIRGFSLKPDFAFFHSFAIPVMVKRPVLETRGWKKKSPRLASIREDGYRYRIK